MLRVCTSGSPASGGRARTASGGGSALGVVLVALGVWLVVAVGVPDLSSVRAEVDVLGFWAGPFFAGLYALITPTPLPKTVLTLAAGAVFGVGYGLVVVLVGATAGAVFAFYLARMLGRDVVLRYFRTAAHRVYAQARRYGVWAVLVLRLVPVVPFTALNWVAGVTAVRIRDFVLATPVGMLPTTAATIAVGAVRRVRSLVAVPGRPRRAPVLDRWSCHGASSAPDPWSRPLITAGLDAHCVAANRSGYSLNAEIGGQLQTRFRSPRAPSTRRTAGHTLARVSSSPMPVPGYAASSRL